MIKKRNIRLSSALVFFLLLLFELDCLAGLILADRLTTGGVCAERVFKISPAVSSKTIWNLDADGKLNLGTTGTWTLTPVCGFQTLFKVWGGGGGGSYAAVGTGGGAGFNTGLVRLEKGKTYKIIVGDTGVGSTAVGYGGNGGFGGGGSGACPNTTAGNGAAGTAFSTGATGPSGANCTAGNGSGGGGGGLSGIFSSATINQASALVIGGGGGGYYGGGGASVGGGSSYAPHGTTGAAIGQYPLGNTDADYFSGAGIGGAAAVGANGCVVIRY